MIKSYIDAERYSVKLGIVFSKLGIPPNVWTVGSLIPAFLGFLSLYNQNLLLGFIFFSISGLLDAIDGAVARVTKSVSNLGAFLDGVIDRYVEFLLYIGIFLYLLPYGSFFMPLQIWIVLLIFGSVMPSYIRAYADHRGVVTEYEELQRMGGIMERVERVGVILLGMLGGVVFSIKWLQYSVALVTILTNLTAFQRIAFAVYHAKRKGR